MIHGGRVSRIPFNRTPRNHESGISEGSRVVADHQGDVPLCVFLGGEGDRRHLPLVLLLAVFGLVGVAPPFLPFGVDDLGVLPIVLAQQLGVLHAPIIPYLEGGASKKTRFIGIS
jgi:hypothetical protein